MSSGGGAGIGAIVGGNVDMSATGPISPANWNSGYDPNWVGYPPYCIVSGAGGATCA
jgi:hypothetical protein